MTPFLLTLPWLALVAYVLLVAKVPRALPGHPPSDRISAPLVSVIVPARNEASNIEACLRSLTASRYPSFEVIVVDDGSEDRTAEIARSVDPGNATRVEVVAGAPLPEGWLGKPFACWQGYARAQGDLLLFTDADTRHGARLLDRAVCGREEEGADLLTVVGRQLMESFWERLVQPQIFLVMLLRFPRFERTARSGRWREAIANGQFLLFGRDAYESIGGHRAVRDEVAEDLALAQRVKRAGLRLRIRGAEDDLATRMYRSLGQIVEGWSKNLLAGGLQSLPAWMRPLAPPLSLAVGVGLWLLPPLALAGSLSGVGGGGLLVWSASVCAVSAALWAVFARQVGAPPGYGLLYPLGALVGVYIFARSWRGGRRVAWKGRRYELPPVSERP